MAAAHLTLVLRCFDHGTLLPPCKQDHISWQSHVRQSARLRLELHHLAQQVEPRMTSVLYFTMMCGRLVAGSDTEAHLRYPAGVGAVAAYATCLLLLLQAALLCRRPPAAAASSDVPVAAAGRLVDRLLGGGRGVLHSIAKAVQAVCERWAQVASYAVANRHQRPVSQRIGAQAAFTAAGCCAV